MHIPPANTSFFSMKITFIHILLTLLFPIMGVHLFSCVRDSPSPDPPETIVVNLPDNLKNNIPYKGFDTLTFIRITDGDTHMFIGQYHFEKFWALAKAVVRMVAVMRMILFMFKVFEIRIIRAKSKLMFVYFLRKRFLITPTISVI